jgi:hypothetical protein
MVPAAAPRAPKSPPIASVKGLVGVLGGSCDALGTASDVGSLGIGAAAFGKPAANGLNGFLGAFGSDSFGTGCSTTGAFGVAAAAGPDPFGAVPNPPPGNPLGPSPPLNCG